MKLSEKLANLIKKAITNKVVLATAGSNVRYSCEGNCVGGCSGGCGSNCMAGPG